MQPECSQEPTTRLHPEPGESNQHHHTLFLIHGPVKEQCVFQGCHGNRSPIKTLLSTVGRNSAVWYYRLENTIIIHIVHPQFYTCTCELHCHKRFVGTDTGAGVIVLFDFVLILGVRGQVSNPCKTTCNIKTSAFWDTVLCSLAEVD
jgi:hypothetical protein